MGYLNKKLFPLLEASFCLTGNKFFPALKFASEPTHLFTTTKLETFREDPSLLKTQKAALENRENTQQEYINKLNKNKIYLLVTTKVSKDKEKLLLLLEPEDRINPEKLLVERRHKVMMARALDNPEHSKESQKSKEKSKIIENRLRTRIQDKDELEKTLKFIERGKEIRKKKSIYLYKDIDRFNPLGKIGTNLALRTPFFKINAKTGELKNKNQNFMTGRINRAVKIYSQFKKHSLDELRFLRDNQSYYMNNRSGLKSICPVFLDKKSAEEFLIQNCEISLSHKNLELKKNLLKIYNNLLKSEEFFVNKFTEEIQESQDKSIKKTANSLSIVENLNNLKLLKLKKSKLDSKINLKEHKDILPSIRRALSVYRKAIKSIKVSSLTKKIGNSSQILVKLPDEVSSTKVISVGLGDFIQQYSSTSESKTLERVEFLFFPKSIETKKISQIDNFISKLGKNKKTENFISNFDLKGKTFKNYQKEYFKEQK